MSDKEIVSAIVHANKMLVVIDLMRLDFSLGAHKFSFNGNNYEIDESNDRSRTFVDCEMKIPFIKKRLYLRFIIKLDEIPKVLTKHQKEEDLREIFYQSHYDDILAMASRALLESMFDRP